MMGSDAVDRALTTFPNTELVVSEVLRRKPMHRRFLNGAIAGLSEAEKAEVELYVSFMIREGVSVLQQAVAYLTIVDDTFREELQFRESGRYRYDSFAKVRAAVYDNPAYMRDYMIGLGLSSFWWSNHTRIRRFFKGLLPQFSRYSGLYREVGPGHGIYFVEALKSCGFATYEGLDISATSIDMTRRLIEFSCGVDVKNVRLVQSDFLSPDPLEPAQMLVMGEVLEHVEEPARFLARAHETTTEDCSFFLTTCINAPAIDHIYNPGTVGRLEDLFAAEGFLVRERCVIGRDGASLEQCEQERLAINVAYVLVKS